MGNLENVERMQSVYAEHEYNAIAMTIFNYLI